MYANVSGTLTRTYPTYSIDPDLNFPPNQSYANRAVKAYNAEQTKIDVIMYRITDQRHTNAILSAHSRGVPIRMILENNEYRDPNYLWDAWNVDQLYAAGIPLRWEDGILVSKDPPHCHPQSSSRTRSCTSSAAQPKRETPKSLPKLQKFRYQAKKRHGIRPVLNTNRVYGPKNAEK